MRLRMPRWCVESPGMVGVCLSSYPFVCVRPALAFVANLSPENYVWSFVCLYLHGSSAVRLLFDEGTVDMGDNDQEALWRYFYRRCGISRLLFKA